MFIAVFQFDEPTLWDRIFCRQLMSNASHIIGPSFVYTSVCKVGRATKVMTFLVDNENRPQKFTRVILKVSNLEDANPVTYIQVIFGILWLMLEK